MNSARDVAFYGLAAQVLPVLFLAAAFENRFLTSRPASYRKSTPDDPAYWNVSQAVGRIAGILFMAIGEVVALVGAFATRSPGSLAVSTVWLALLTGIWALVWPLIAGQWNYLKQQRAAKGGSDVVFLVIATTLIVGFFVSSVFTLASVIGGHRQ